MDLSFIQSILSGSQAPQPSTPLGQAMAADPMDFGSKYNTQLPPDQEAAFAEWAKQNNKMNDVYDYDIRGAWRELMSGQMQGAENGHLGDKYKKPNHPTFSNESVYHGQDGYSGGSWSQDQTGRYTFAPSGSHMWDQEALQRYFSQYEKDSNLLPRK